MNKNKPIVLVVVGPTASGKTSLGINIAKTLNGEIISADSMQIYKGLDIGTAKATREEQNEIRHHLIDICDIDTEFSVAEYKKLCYEKIDEILALNKIPVLVGGTGLYINAVVNNMNFDNYSEKKESNIRKELESILTEKGPKYLYDMLIQLDEEAAKNIHVNNTKRVLRAIELAKEGIYKGNIDKRNDLWNRNDSKYKFITIYIDMPRQKLYDRINMRVDLMKESGIIEEAIMLKNKRLSKNNTAVQAIGYKEFFDYIDKKETLDEALEKLKQNSRRYAKRQITWFKKLNCDIIYNDEVTYDKLIEDVKRKMYE